MNGEKIFLYTLNTSAFVISLVVAEYWFTSFTLIISIVIFKVHLLEELIVGKDFLKVLFRKAQNEIAADLKTTPEQIIYRRIPILGHGEIVLGLVINNKGNHVSVGLRPIIKTAFQKDTTINLQINGSRGNIVITASSFTTGIFEDISNTDTLSINDFIGINVGEKTIWGPFEVKDLIQGLI